MSARTGNGMRPLEEQGVEFFEGTTSADRMAVAAWLYRQRNVEVLRQRRFKRYDANADRIRAANRARGQARRAMQKAGAK